MNISMETERQYVIFIFSYMNQVKRAFSQKNLTLLNANNKGTDQTAHLMRILISALVIGSLVNMLGKLVTYKISIF